jgi:hypothetical protein
MWRARITGGLALSWDRLLNEWMSIWIASENVTVVLGYYLTSRHYGAYWKE